MTSQNMKMRKEAPAAAANARRAAEAALTSRFTERGNTAGRQSLHIYNDACEARRTDCRLESSGEIARIPSLQYCKTAYSEIPRYSSLPSRSGVPTWSGLILGTEKGKSTMSNEPKEGGIIVPIGDGGGGGESSNCLISGDTWHLLVPFTADAWTTLR